MKTTKTTFLLGSLLALILCATACKKTDTVNPNAGNTTNNGSNSGTTTGTSTGTHSVDARLAGKWLWTQGSNTAYYDNNGTYSGSAYGFACQFNINADGSGTCYNHIYSTLNGSTGLEVNISYVGFFESDDQGQMGFFPTGGTYQSNGVTRPLRADELWNVNTNTGVKFLYQKLVYTTQGNRVCFQVTATDGTTDTYFKVN